jgi:hypothetical protein
LDRSQRLAFQVHRETRRLPCDCGPRGRAFAEWHTRRAHGPGATPGDHAENYGISLDKGTADAEAVAHGLLGSLRHEQRIMPEAIDEKTAELLKKLEKS